MTIRPDLIASRYDGLPAGPSLLYSFEEQDAIPVDGTRQLPRDLSPFTLRLVLPDHLRDFQPNANNVFGIPLPNRTSLLPDLTSQPRVSVNVYSGAGDEIARNNAQAGVVQRQYGVNMVTGAVVGVSTRGAPSVSEQLYYEGEAVLQANGSSRKMVTLSDKFTAIDIKYQVEQIIKAPPLTLLVNPNNMSTSYAAVQKYTDRTRFGFVFERWGEEQVKISFSGTTGAFIAGENSQRAVNSMQTTTPTGVQFASKRNSAAFQNFTALYQFYRHNGYLRDTYGKTEAHLAIGAVAIDYDQFTYIGHIESFDYSYKSDMPHRIEWNMEFVADKMFDRAGQPASLGPMRGPYVNPLSGAVPVTPTTPASTSSQAYANPAQAQTPFELLGRR